MKITTSLYAKGLLSAQIGGQKRDSVGCGYILGKMEWLEQILVWANGTKPGELNNLAIIFQVSRMMAL